MSAREGQQILGARGEWLVLLDASDEVSFVAYTDWGLGWNPQPWGHTWTTSEGFTNRSASFLRAQRRGSIECGDTH